jgi:Cys-rich repeat protein
MKKLKLKALELGAMELLTRTQLKNVLGGDDYGIVICTQCTSDSDCGYGHVCRESKSCPFENVCALPIYV